MYGFGGDLEGRECGLGLIKIHYMYMCDSQTVKC